VLPLGLRRKTCNQLVPKGGGGGDKFNQIDTKILRGMPNPLARCCGR